MEKQGRGRQTIGVIFIIIFLAFIVYGMFLGSAQWDHIWYAILAILLTLIWIDR